MYCPQCERQLESSSIGGVSFLSCPHTHGILLKSGTELGTVLETYINIHELPHASIDSNKKIQGHLLITEDPLLCPECKKQMRLINYGYDSNIILDTCVSCGAKWLDAGELEKLAIYRKGNPLHRQLGETLLTDHNKIQEFKDNTQAMRLAPAYIIQAPFLIGDDETSLITPWGTMGLILANCLVYLVHIVYQTGNGLLLLAFKGGGEFGILSLFTLITSMFFHLDFFHLAGNMLYLWVFGDQIEEAFGTIKFLIFYLIIGILATILSYPFYNSGTILYGASGAISGIMGAYLYLHPRARLHFLYFNGIIKIPAYYFFAFWFVQNLTISVINAQQGHIAWVTHAVGFLLGLFGMRFYLRLHPPRIIQP